ncbi:MAG: S9 family peptidase [Cyclobacteriaceae bacterium]|nr:S9 family peptidase [Cyclobacteriaceae bacterium]MCH8516359.1 S9 family peptidase [Cyclobacteriaceae bacterium]
MTTKKLILSILLPILVLSSAWGQKEISFDDIYRNYTFYPRSVSGINWMKDGGYYTALVRDTDASSSMIVKYDIRTGNSVDTLLNGADLGERGIRFDDYRFSADENKVLLMADKESIYRRSFEANYFIVDLADKSAASLAEGKGKLSYATFSPDGSRVAYVRDNNLYVTQLSDMSEKAITTDGKENEIINGAADWVYEEEFSIAQAFDWSPDGKHIAFLRFDESDVKEYNMQMWGSLYPSDYRFKYPKAGEDNAIVEAFVYSIEDNQLNKVDTGSETDQYVMRMYWTPDSKTLALIRLNRLQNKLDILHAHPSENKVKTVLTENADTYVDINYTDDLKYLKDNKHFLRTSEKDGNKHIYLHKLDGSLVRQITAGDWEVTSLVGIDEKNDLIYYLSTEGSSMDRHFYSINTKGKKKKKLSGESGTYRVNMSPDYSFYIQYFSSANIPNQVSLHSTKSTQPIKVMQDNAQLQATMADYQFTEKEFMQVPAANGEMLNAYMIKPFDFDENKQYPMLMYVYGGPGSQTVLNSWDGRAAWHQHIANQGFIVVSVDNRGTGGKGRDFKHSTYKQLGKLEVEDQVAAAKHLSKLDYIDADRMGIWGWSYGGYMSANCVMQAPEVFKLAIAVAPVTNWRFYDTIYTERYLQRPQDNSSGYDDNSPLSHVDKLKGEFLLIHGTADDNVHFQNAVELQEALIQANKQFKSFYYPDRNHGIYGGNTTYHLHRMMTDFILEKL